MRILVLVVLACAAAIPALAQTPTPVAAQPQQQHPVGGYLKHPKPSLIRIEVKWEDASGYPLYVLDRECFAQCARVFPPLTPIKGDAPPSPDWTIRVREENGDMQWVYKGRPVYTYSGDYVDRPERKLPDGSTNPPSVAQPPKGDKIVPWVALARP